MTTKTIQELMELARDWVEAEQCLAEAEAAHEKAVDAKIDAHQEAMIDGGSTYAADEAAASLGILCEDIRREAAIKLDKLRRALS